MKDKLKFIDLFAGIGGIRLAFENAGCECVWSNDIDKYSAVTYTENFGKNEHVIGDIKKIKASDIPDFDILCGGFPCQPFSIAGISKKNSLGKPSGFNDTTQGTMFHEIVRIISEKKNRIYRPKNRRALVIIFFFKSGRQYQAASPPAIPAIINMYIGLSFVAINRTRIITGTNNTTT